MTHEWQSDEQEMAHLVSELLRSGTVPEEVADEVERLYSVGRYNEALLYVLDAGE